jgi:sulfotransferase
MVEKIFFQSSMPRSGSTLLQNVLAQNPDIYSTATSGLCETLLQAKNCFSNYTEFKAQDQNLIDQGSKGFYKNGLFGYYNNVTNKKYIIEKSRGWGISYDFVDSFYKNPKMIIMVRDLRSIVSSLEKKFRENPNFEAGIQNYNQLTGTTVDKRVNLYLTSVPPLAGPLDFIYDIIIRKIHKNLLFIKFEDFCTKPETEMKKIYEYLQIPYYAHNFDNIEQVTKEDDNYYKPFGDHMIRGKIQPITLDYIDVLGKHNCDFIYQNYSWYFKSFKYNYEQ